MCPMSNKAASGGAFSVLKGWLHNVIPKYLRLENGRDNCLPGAQNLRKFLPIPNASYPFHAKYR